MMESPGGGILGRLGEKVLGYVALGLIAVAGVALYKMGPEGRAALWNGFWRTAVWIGIAAGLPWVARLFVTRLLELGTNWAGVVLLAALTLVDGVAGVILMSGWPSGGWGWTAAIAALAVAGLYNYLVAEYLSEQAGG
jgi:hypothetical protein